LSPSDFVVGFVGRIEREKGVRVLWDALAPLMAASSRIHLLCVGDGPELKPWQMLAQDAGVASRCHFAGWTAQIGDYYSAMNLLVAPSIAPETFCRVIAEAQASGVAVIGARIGGIPEAFMPGRTGLLAEPGDVHGLRHLISRLFNDPGLCARYGEAGRQCAYKHFAAGHIGERFVAALGPEGTPDARHLEPARRLIVVDTA
jgi:phosphatidylinositol alpha-1,6-mannosyltransferase